MDDNSLYTEIKAILDAYIALQWAAPAQLPIVKLAGQQGVTGMPSGPVIFIRKLFDAPYGSPRRTSKLDPDDVSGALVWTARQVYESTVQVTAHADEGALTTASDLANWARAVFELDPVLERLASKGAGVLRVAQVRETPYQNDRNQTQYVPSFDLVVRHARSLKIAVPRISRFREGIHRV